jgi:CDGSH-type Zn-finger protein
VDAKPKLACLPNGPYTLAGARLRGASGQELPYEGKAALCRCGGSNNKPFCDGTHRTNGFSDRKLADPANDTRSSYAGKRITILDNRALCAHAGYCTDGLKAVFRYREEPWIDPDGAAAQEVIATIRRCPSGALSYAIDGVEAPAAQRAPMVSVTRDGPYAVTGALELAGAQFGDGASGEHYTLCRCGASRNKPFCDGSHWDAGFRDPVGP